jgi:hypothetical protein
MGALVSAVASPSPTATRQRAAKSSYPLPSRERAYFSLLSPPPPRLRANQILRCPRRIEACVMDRLFPLPILHPCPIRAKARTANETPAFVLV